MDGPEEKKGRGYHHGNLRAALVEAALSLIGEKGPHGFSFAEAARRAGVSAAAPYRHFKDRDDLIAEAARAGFDLFADRLEAAWDKGRPSPLKALEAVGVAYLDFARREPAHFAAMFGAGMTQEPAPELRAASERAFGVLYRATEAVLIILPPDARPPAHMASYHIWALSHGVAALFGTEQRAAPISAVDLLESGVAIYLRGLGVIGD